MLRQSFGTLRLWLRRYHQQTADRVVSIALVLPLLVFYGLGIWQRGPVVMNGADLISSALHTGLGHGGYLILHGMLAAGGFCVLWLARSKRRFEWRFAPFLLLECLAYAWLFYGVLVLILSYVVRLGPVGLPPTWVDRLIIAAGAGFHEELWFRLILIPGSCWLLAHLLRGRQGPAILAAIVVSAVVFALAHYLGPERFAWRTFAFRAVAGLFFAALFVLRGFAVACYSHAFYDGLVFFL